MFLVVEVPFIRFCVFHGIEKVYSTTHVCLYHWTMATSLGVRSGSEGCRLAGLVRS